MIKDEQLLPWINGCVITPPQLRAARSMLDWSRGELAKEAKLSAETIKNIEHGTFSPKEETLKTLLDTFARHGIQFIHNETAITVSAACEPAGHALTFSCSGVIRMTASNLDVGGIAQ